MGLTSTVKKQFDLQEFLSQTGTRGSRRGHFWKREAKVGTPPEPESDTDEKAAAVNVGKDRD